MRHEWFFIQVSDPQLGMMRPGADTYDEVPLVEAAVARLNALAPDFVLCTGDLIDQPGSEPQMARSRGLWDRLDPAIPFLVVPGNHDIGDAPTPDSLAWFHRQVGRDRFSFEHRGWHFCGVNSCLLARGDAAPAEAAAHWAWLADDLTRAVSSATERTVVFMHQPPFLRQADEADDYFNLPRGPRRRCLELFRECGVHTVLAGHLHRCLEASAAGVDVVVTGPVGMPLQGGRSGLRIVRVRGGAWQHRYCALEDVGDQVSFLAGEFSDVSR